MRKQVGRILFSLLVLTLFGGTVLAQTGDGFDLTWNVIGGGGGGGPMTGSGFFVDSTLGQTAIGPATQGDWWLGQGYWYGTPSAFGVYLPLVFKGWD